MNILLLVTIAIVVFVMQASASRLNPRPLPPPPPGYRYRSDVPLVPRPESFWRSYVIPPHLDNMITIIDVVRQRLDINYPKDKKPGEELPDFVKLTD